MNCEKGAENGGSLLLLAKPSGITSFDALWDVKHALGTRKIGHTGTLDSFADGLLVVLSGKLTKLVDHITALDKEYRAVFVFGQETDTLDPSGAVVRSAALPSIVSLRQVLPLFTGALLQRPPIYSAVHVSGRRASECARSGETVALLPRPVTVYALDLVSFSPATDGNVASAEFRIVCSKGTYIRSLARDIGAACNSAAYVSYLRRTRVGAFQLADAALSGYLPEFAADNSSAAFRPERPALHAEIRAASHSFSSQLAVSAGLDLLVLASAAAESAFLQGKALSPAFFDKCDDARFAGTGKCAVFSASGQFLGVIVFDRKILSYGFVVGCSA